MMHPGKVVGLRAHMITHGNYFGSISRPFYKKDGNALGKAGPVGQMISGITIKSVPGVTAAGSSEAACT